MVLALASISGILLVGRIWGPRELPLSFAAWLVPAEDPPAEPSPASICARRFEVWVRLDAEASVLAIAFPAIGEGRRLHPDATWSPDRLPRTGPGAVPLGAGPSADPVFEIPRGCGELRILVAARREPVNALTLRGVDAVVPRGPTFVLGALRRLDFEWRELRVLEPGG